MADSDGAKGSNFGESFADVDEGEVGEGEEGSGGDEGAEDAGEAGAFAAGGVAVFEDGFLGFAGAVAGFVAGFGADEGGGAEFDDLNVGEDGGDFGADFAEAVDAGAVASAGSDYFRSFCGKHFRWCRRNEPFCRSAELYCGRDGLGFLAVYAGVGFAGTFPDSLELKMNTELKIIQFIEDVETILYSLKS